MRILFIIPSLTGGGAERVVTNLANSMCDKNEVNIYTIVSTKSFYSINKKVKVISNNVIINKKNKITKLLSRCTNFLRVLKNLKNTIGKYKPDCIISFLPEADILSFLACRKNMNVSVVYSERNDPTRRPLYLRLLLKKIYGTSDLFICQSKKVFEYYNNISSDKKIIIPNPISNNLPDTICVEKNHNIVAIGRFYNQKNFELLIRSYVLAINNLPNDCNLVIYGDGPLRDKYQRIILENNLQNRIILPGIEKNIFEKINGSALFVLSSDYEGFPNSLVEAMAIGLPVISTNFYTGVAKDIIDSKNGIVVPVGDKKKLCDSIVYLMNNDKKRFEMRKNNYKIRKNYDIKKISEIWIKEITNLREK